MGKKQLIDFVYLLLPTHIHKVQWEKNEEARGGPVFSVQCNHSPICLFYFSSLQKLSIKEPLLRMGGKWR